MLRKTKEELFKAIQLYSLPPPCCRDSGICELKKGSISKEIHLAQVPFEDYPEVERIFRDYIISSVRRHSPKDMEGVWVDFWGDGKDTMNGPMERFIKLSRLLEKVID
ncbi:MAG: hypothetical protein HXX80_04345 [Nitrososphaerales archaeon]|nr:hypothetical protein [Nitrososphaerales archaeon]